MQVDSVGVVPLAEPWRVDRRLGYRAVLAPEPIPALPTVRSAPSTIQALPPATPALTTTDWLDFARLTAWILLAAMSLTVIVLVYRALHRRSLRPGASRGLYTVMRRCEAALGCCDRELRELGAGFVLVSRLFAAIAATVVGALLALSVCEYRRLRMLFSRVRGLALRERRALFVRALYDGARLWWTSSWNWRLRVTAWAALEIWSTLDRSLELLARPFVTFCDASSAMRIRWASRAVHWSAVAAAIVAVVFPVVPPQVLAADFYWDGDFNILNNSSVGTGLGTSGFWNTSGSNWWNLTADTAWQNGGLDTAVFWGTAATSSVTLGSNITVGGLKFNATGYTINTGANTLSFGATDNTITFNNVAAAGIAGGVGGTGNVTLSGGAYGGVTAGTFTLNGASSGGWSGTTTINNGMTMALSQSNQALANTSGITFSGGNLTLTNATLTEAGLDRINDSAGITAKGGTLTITNTVAAATPYSESIGAVSLVSGQFNIVSTNANTGGTQLLTIDSLSRTGASNSSAITFGIGGGGGVGITTNQINVTGQSATAANEIIGPWATVGTTAASQVDYAVYNINAGAANALGIQGAGIAATTNGSWTTATNAYTLGAADTLSATRTVAALRYSGAAATFALGASSLETYGLLNGGTGLLTITSSGGAIRTPTGGGNLYITTGSNAITLSTGTISDNGGAVTLIKSGTGGTLTLTAANSYSGGTVLNAGVISIPADASLGTGGAITVNGNSTLQITTGVTVAATRNIALNNGATLTFDNVANAVTIGGGSGGNITGSGNISNVGTTGNLTLSGSNTFTGAVFINPAGAGNLIANNATALGNSNNAVIFTATASRGGLVLNNNLSVGSISGGAATGGGINLQANTLTVGGNDEHTTYNGVISGAGGSITKVGTGTLRLGGTNTFTGAPQLKGGLVNITTLGNLGNGTEVIFDGGGIQLNASIDPSTRTLTFNSGGATIDTNGNQVALANAVGNSGTGGLTKSGTGTLRLSSSSNNYSGNTTVTGGVLAPANAGALGIGSAITVTGGALQLTSTSSQNFGTKTLTLNGAGAAGNVSGALINSGGTNTFAGDLALGSSATISVDAGALILSSTEAVTGGGTLTLAGSGTGTLAAALATGSGGLIKTGGGTWNLTGTGGSNTGPLAISGGVLNVTGGALGSLSGTSLSGGSFNLVSGTQSIGDLTVAADSVTRVSAAGGSTLTTGATINRSVGGVVAFDVSTGGTIATAAGGSGLAQVLGFATVTDSVGTGMAQISGGNLVRFNPASGSGFTSFSNDGNQDFVTTGITSPFAWSNGITTRSVNSLTFDTAAGDQVVNMGPVSNVLTITSGAIGLVGSNDATLLGGRIGANNSEVIVQQHGTGVLSLDSPISSGTGSLIKLGSGALHLSGGISTVTGTLNGTTTVTVADTSGLTVGQTVSGGGIAANTTIAAITSGTTFLLSTAATTNMSSSLTVGTGSTYSGETTVIGGTIVADASSRFTADTVGSLNRAGYVSSTGGPLGIGSNVTLSDTAGAALDVNGYNVAVGTLSGGGSSGGNLVLNNGGSLIVVGGNFINNIGATNVGTTFGGQISGTGNLTITGGGTLRLTNDANNFSGQVNVNQGTLVVTDGAALGSASLVAVNGVASGALNNAGLPAGMLVVQGGLAATGTSVANNLSFSGRGNNTVGAAFINIGNNTYTGIIGTSGSAETRVGSVAGTLRLGNEGTLSIGTVANSLYATAGVGNIVLNGVVTGGAAATVGIRVENGGVLAKTVVLNNYGNNFVGEVQAVSGTVRASHGGALGVGTSANTIRGQGNWEIRTDNPGSFATRNLSTADGNLNLMLDRAVGGSGIGTVSFSTDGLPTYGAGGNVTFGALAKTVATTPIVSGRDGYGAAFNGAAGTFGGVASGANNYTNSSNGLVTWNGSMGIGTGATSRALTIDGNGDTMVTGFVQNAGSGVNTLVKAGQGTLVMNGANTTAAATSNNLGGIQVQAGTLLVTQAGGGTATIANLVGSATGSALQLGNTSTAVAALDFRVDGGETVSKILIQPGTTGSSIVLANQASGALVFTNPIAAGQAGGKTLYLGGTSTGANEISAVINGNGNIAKIGSGTWLYDPQPTTYQAQPTGWTAASGAANSNTIVLNAGGAGTIRVGMAVSGGNTPAGAVVTNVSGNTITISNNIGTALAANQALTFGANANFTGNVTVAGGTLQIKPTAATGNGANLFATSNNLIFNTDAITGNGLAGGTFQLATPSATLSTNLIQTMGALTLTAGQGKVQVDSGNNTFSNIVRFNTLGTRTAGATVNFAPASSLAGVQFVTAPTGLSGQIGGFAYITNATSGAIDFVATPSANTNVAALGAATAFSTATSGTGTTNFVLTGNTVPAGAAAVNTLRIVGSGQTINLGGTLTVTNTSATAIGGVLFDNTAGGATINNQNIAGTVAANELIFVVGGNAGSAAANALTLNSTIGGSGAAQFVKTGNGMMVLGGANAFTGNVFINEGVVQLAGTTSATIGAPAAGTTLVLRQGATFDVNNSGPLAAPYTGATSLRTTSIGVLSGAGSITNGLSGTPGAAAISIGVTASNVSGVFSGVISDGTSGAGGLTVIRNGASGSVALTGANTYTGATILSGGATLQANVLADGGVESSIGKSSSAAANLVFNGGTLLYQGANATVYSPTQTPSVAIDRLFTLAGNGTIDSSGTYGSVNIGTTTANNAALVFDNTGSIAVAGADSAKTLTLRGSSTGDNEIRSRLVDGTGSRTVAVTKLDGGLWILGNSNNTYSGATTITQGILRAQDANSNVTSATTFQAGTSTTDFWVNSTAGLSVGQAVTAGGSGTIAAILDETHIRLSASQTIAANTTLTFGSINSLSANSNVLFNQTTAGTEAILEMTGTFSRAVGASANQVQWASNASGGFAASSGPLDVTFGGSASFGTGSGFIGNGTGQLYLNSTTALSNVTVSGNLNLNGGVRTVNVFDNTTTNTDYAVISGVISGGAGSGLTKAGNGLLYLTGANTFSGNTTLTAGTTIVNSIGGGSTTASAFGDGSGILLLGNGTTGTPNLIYAGAGETATRQININSTTGNITIEASGSGALVLTNVVNAVAGAKTLILRGYSNDANAISSSLNDNGGALSITKSDGGTWTLSGANTYTGTTTVNAGFLGIAGSTSGTPGTAVPGAITISNAGIFAADVGGLVMNNTITISSNTLATFTGTNSITVNGNINGATGNPWQIANTISGGTLTVNGNINNMESATGRSFTIYGTGNTFLNGTMTSAGANVGLAFNTSGKVTLGGTAMEPVQHTSTTITQGQIVNSRQGNTNPFGSNSILVMAGGSLESTVVLTGSNAIVNSLQLTNIYGVIAGTQSIEFVGNATTGSLENNGGNRQITNNISGGGLLTFSTNAVRLNDAGTAARTLTLAGTGAYSISAPITNGGGTGNSILTYAGTGTLGITGTNTYTGAANFQGGTTTISGTAGNVSNAGTATITVLNGATLTLDNTSAYTGNRMNNRPLTLTGGTFNFIGNSAGTVEGSAGAGALTAGVGQASVEITNNGGTTQLVFGSLSLTANGGTIDFTSNAQLGTATNQIIFNTTAPTLSPTTIGLLARATVSGDAAASGGVDFATYNTTGLQANVFGLQAFDAYNVPTLSSTTTVGVNVTVASTAGLSAGMAVYGGNGVNANSIATITGPTTFTLTNAATSASAVSLVYGTTAYTNINSALVPASTDTIKLGVGFIPSAGNADDINTNRSFNAVNIAGNGIDLGSTAGSATLTITSGGLIVSGGANTLSVPRVALSTTEGAFHIASGASLNVTGQIIGTGGLDKNLGGTLTLSNDQFYTGATVVNAGTLRLAGGTNTLFFGQTLTVNNGATLDLNGATQYAGNFTSGASLVPGAGGTVTTSTGTANLVTNAANGAWAGTITDAAGAITNFARIGGNTLTMYDENSYKGSTTVLGGTLALSNNGTLANTSSITINYGTFTIDNNASLAIDNTNRVNDAAPISLSGGTITFTGRPNSNSSESFGALTAAQGANTITGTMPTAVGLYQGVDISFASLTRAAGATINFTGTNLGSEGNAPRITFASPPANNASNVLGAWAIANSEHYAAYNAAQGVGAVGSAGYVGYEAAFGAGNITQVMAGSNLATTLPSGGATTELLRLTSGAAGVQNDILFTNASDKLTLVGGGLLHNNVSAGSLIGSQATPGILTAGNGAAGTTELIVYNANATTASGTLTASPVTNVTSISLTAPPTTITPGMMVTGTGVTSGTYVTSVSGATIGLSTANSLAASAALTFTPAFVINSSIQDFNTGAGAYVSLVKSGAGLLTLTNANAYSGTTIVNQGTLNLASLGTGTASAIGTATNVVIPGDLIINGGITGAGAAVTMQNNVGQIDASSNVTLNGRATLTLAGASGLNNTLSSITFNNIGGEAAPTVSIAASSILTLSSTSPITATSGNANNTAIISGGTLALQAGTNTVNVGAVQLNGVNYAPLVPTLTISSIIANSTTAAAISKTGAGTLRLGAASTFTGGTAISAGSLILGSSSNVTTQAINAGTGSNTASGSTVITSGPIGTNSLIMAANTALLIDNTNRTIVNPITFQGNPVFQNTTYSATAVTMTLAGAINYGVGANPLTINVDNPSVSVVLNGPTSGLNTVTSFTKTGTGNLAVNLTGLGSNVPITFSDGGNMDIRHDGDGDVQVEAIYTGALSYDAAVPNITLGRAGQTVLWNQAINKIIAPSSFNGNAGNGMTVANSNQYGLVVADDFALNSSLSAAGATYSVGTASASNILPGLTFSGQISGGATGSNSIVLAKSGNGALALTNTNTFGGGSSIIDVTAGILTVTSNEALGDPANVVRISTNSATNGLRLAGGTAYTLTGRTIRLNAAANGIDVTGGTTATLDTAFTFSAATNALQKNDNGTLAFTASVNNTNLTGNWTVANGALRIAANQNLNAATNNLTISSGAALQLNGGETGVTLNKSGTINLTGSGINSAGALQSMAGTGANSVTSLLTLVTAATTIGADSGSVLNITGGISGAFALTFNTSGTGTINISNTAINANVTPINKIGSGTLNWSVASGLVVAPINVNDGTFTINGSGTLGATGIVTVNSGATLMLENSAANTNNRLGGRPIQPAGGNITLMGNASSATSETTGTWTVNAGQSVITVDANASQSTTLTLGTAAAVTRSAGGTALFLGDNLGSAPAAGVSVITGTSTFGLTFIGATGATDSVSKSIVPWALVDAVNGNGASFATADAPAAQTTSRTASVRALKSTEYVTTLGVSAATNNNAVLSTSNALFGPQTINSLTLNSGGGIVTLPMQTLTLQSGGILAQSGNANITGPAVGTATGIITTTSNAEAILFTPGTASLQINAVITGSTGGLSKNGTGTVELMKVSPYTGTTFVNAGTLKLSGGTNTLSAGGAALVVNGGGTLDLNGNVQLVGNLTNQGAAQSVDVTGGTITSSVAGGTLVVNQTTTATFFSGSITGNSLAFNRSGTAAVFNLLGTSSYGGSTLINGGNTVISDYGAITGTSSIDINYATVTINNNTSLIDMPDRVRDGAPITLRGGSFSFNGRAQTASSEKLGAVTLAQGLNTITVNTGSAATVVNSAELTLTSLAQTANSGAVLNIVPQAAGTASTAALGQAGSNPRLIVDGATAANVITNGLDDNIIPWAIVNASDFASYVEYSTFGGVSAGGFGALNSAGYAGYDASVLPSGNQPNQNIKVSATAAVGSTSLTINSLNLSAVGVTFTSDAAVLNLASGGLLHSGATATIGGTTAGTRGQLTAGTTAGVTSPLYVTNGANTLTINSTIVDNNTSGTGKTALIATNIGATTISLAPQVSNTYSGGTILNGGTFNMTGAVAGVTVIPSANGLTLNGASLTTQDLGIAQTTVITLNGASTLTLPASPNQTVGGLIFNNNGGGTAAQPTVTAGTVQLGAGAQITATSSNVGTVATIASALNLGTGTRTIQVDAITVNSQSVAPLLPTLNITGVISNGSILKTGSGLLQLSTATSLNTLANINVSAGGVIVSSMVFNAATTFTVSGTNTVLTADATARTVSNSVNLQNAATAVTLGNYGAAGLTLSGPITWSTTSGVNRTVTVDSAAGVTLLSGQVTSAGTGNGITKAGIGTLVLSNVSNSSTFNTPGAAAVVINNGTLEIQGATLTSYEALGTNPGSPVSNNIVINGGVLSLNLTQATSALNANRGIVVGAPTGSNAGTISVASGKTVTYSGAIADNGTGADSFIKSGAGTLILNGTNTFTGTAYVSQGTLRLGGGNAIGNNTAVAVQNSGTLDLASVSETIGSLSGTSGSITLGTATLTVNQSADGILYTPVTGAAGSALIKNGNGALALAGINSGTFLGNTTVNAGTLSISAANNLGAGTLTLTNATLQVTGTTPVSLTQNFNTSTNPTFDIAAGQTVTLTQAINIPYSKIGDGTLILGGGAGSGATTTVTDGILRINSAATSFPIVLDNGAVEFGVTGAHSGLITLEAGSTGTLTAAPGVTVTLDGNITNDNAVATAAQLQFTGTGAFQVNGSISDSLGTPTQLVVNGPTVSLNTPNSYSGSTSVLGGILQFNSDANLGTAPGTPTGGHLVINGGSLQLNDLTPGTPEVLNANRGIVVGPSTGTGNGTIDVPSGATLSYSGVIADNGSGAGTLVKTGTGKLQVGGQNTNSGGVNVQQGTLQLLNGGSFSSDLTVRVGAMFIGAGDGDGNLVDGDGPGALNTLVVEAGGAFSPGASPGYLLVNDSAWAANSIYNVEINDNNGSAGNDPGWDLLDVSNILDLGTQSNPVSAANPITINLITLDPNTNLPGQMANFVSLPSTGNLIWQFARFGTLRINGNVLNQDTDLTSIFTVNTTGFQNPGLTAGLVVMRSGDGLYFTATPEPSTIVIWSLFGAGAFAWRRRNKRRPGGDVVTVS